MNLGIVGTGTMGMVTAGCGAEDGFFNEIFLIEPLKENCWPEEKLDLIIDFSHPKALIKIYEYCRKSGGGIPVVLATTGYSTEDETIIEMLEKICPVKRSTNFSRGVDVMTKICKTAAEILLGMGAQPDIRILESHHTKKLDAPSGTALTLADSIRPSFSISDAEDIASLRMGTVFGEHSVYFALEDEVLEIRHTAFSKKIFAAGAIAEGKKMVKSNTF